LWKTSGYESRTNNAQFNRDKSMNKLPLRGIVLNYVLLFIVASVTGLSACQRQEVEREPVVRPVRILTIGEAGVGRNLTYSGQIRAGETASLGFEVSGRIIDLPVIEGQQVSAGDLLARLDPADFQSQLDQAEANYRQAQTTFERYQEIVERGAVSRQELDLRQRNYEVAQAELATARKALSDTRLVAPFSGEIGRRLVDNFVNVRAKEAVVVLQDLTNLEMVISIPEQDWARARPGLTREQRTDLIQPMVSLSMIPNRSFPARLKEVATVADPITRTFEVIAEFDNPTDVSVLPGMTANISITVPSGNVVANEPAGYHVPANAVLADEQGNATVWKIDPETMTATRVAVQVGEMAGSDVRVLAGLNPGDRVATTGVHNLREGMQVSELRQ
jgi:RND family efflux transporter MFP subunit